MSANQLYFGDNLNILRRHFAAESVDFVYLDPPFKSNQDYNVLFAERDGTQAAAQIKAFEDTWRWDEAAVRACQEAVESGGRVADALQAFRMCIGENDMLAYLTMMAPRLKELRRVLKPTGRVSCHRRRLEQIFRPIHHPPADAPRRNAAPPPNACTAKPARPTAPGASPVAAASSVPPTAPTAPNTTAPRHASRQPAPPSASPAAPSVAYARAKPGTSATASSAIRSCPPSAGRPLRSNRGTQPAAQKAAPKAIRHRTPPIALPARMPPAAQATATTVMGRATVPPA